MCCDGQKYHTGYSTICMTCGKEKKCFENSIPSYLQSHEKLRTETTYSREYRFATLLKKTILHHNGPTVESPVWKHLFAANKTKKFTSPNCIVQSLSRLQMKNKHYDSLTIFCVVFDLCKRPKVTDKQYAYGIALFKELQRRWDLSPNFTRFFSYYWLLNKVLQLIGCTYLIQYTKKLKCPKRNLYYDTLLDTLGIKLSK